MIVVAMELAWPCVTIPWWPCGAFFIYKQQLHKKYRNCTNRYARRNIGVTKAGRGYDHVETEAVLATWVSEAFSLQGDEF